MLARALGFDFRARLARRLLYKMISASASALRPRGTTLKHSNAVQVRLVASSETKTYDTSKGLNGNPVILTTQCNSINFNTSDMFNSFHVSSNFLQNGYIEIELEVPTANQNVEFLAGFILNLFFITLVIIDEDVEVTKDLTLAPPIDYNNYNINMPIRPY